jgi:S-DNA-T family DNA segregation ATPase FtsK/SpoIIIE
VNASTLSEYRDLTGRHHEPRMLLLIDGFAEFRQQWEGHAHRAEVYATCLRVLSEGRPLGVHLIATADRYGAVPTAVSANITKRIVLRLADEHSYGMFGVARDVLHERSAPGRSLIDGAETQVAVIGGTSNVAEQHAAALKLAAQFAAHGLPPAKSIEALPVRYDAAVLPEKVDGLPALGLSDTTLEPVGFEPAGTLLIAGPPLSGKTTALHSLIRAMMRFDPEVKLCHIGGRRSALAAEYAWHAAASRIEDVRELAQALTERIADESNPTRHLVVIENLLDYADTDADRALQRLFQAANRSEQLVIADGETSQLGSSYGLVGELKASRHGIALQPDTYDGDALFKVQFSQAGRHEFSEGRGIYVARGKTLTVQLPFNTA